MYLLWILYVAGALEVTSKLSYAQLECSNDIPVNAICQNSTTPDEWISELAVSTVAGLSATLAFNCNPTVNTFSEGYVIFWRRQALGTEPPGEWNKTRGLLCEFSTVIDGLTPDTHYEAVVCLREVQNLSQNGTYPVECGLCVVCFTTQNGSIEFVRATATTFTTGLLDYRCEVASYVPPEVTWDAELANGTRAPLMETGTTAFQIHNYVSLFLIPPEAGSILSYNPADVDFVNPECYFDNGMDNRRIVTSEFEQIMITPPPATDEITLIRAEFDFPSDGTLRYICHVMAPGGIYLPPSINWEADNSFNDRITLDNDPSRLYSMDTVVNRLIRSDDPTFEEYEVIGTLAYRPDEVSFTDPDCIASNGVLPPLVVRNSQFTRQDPTTPTVVETVLWITIVLLVISVLLICCVVTLCCALCYVRKRRRRPIKLEFNDKPAEHNDYSNAFSLDVSNNHEASTHFRLIEAELPREMIIPSSCIIVSTVVGQGEFGVVYKGTLTRNNHRELVAVKTLKGIFATANDIQSFTEEILILQHFNHPNVISMIGVCLGADKVGGGPSIILPFMSKGSLLNFIRKEADRLRPSKDADVTQIGAVEKSLVQICLQVARGMEYLAGQRFVHRDLAARNCMIDQNDQIKVGDFGLTEDIYAKNYFRQTSSDGVKLPVKWMAPESLKLGVFSEKSDVWSYGVTCWEVFSCGEIPYPGIHPQQVLNLLEDGQRLGKPRNPACSDQMYLIISSCWEASANHRNTFSELCSIAECYLTTMSDYLNLNVIANTQFIEESPSQSIKDEEETVADKGSFTVEVAVPLLGEGYTVAAEVGENSYWKADENTSHSTLSM